MGQSPSRTPGEFLKYKKLHYRHIEKVFFEYSSSNMYPTTFNQIQIVQRVVQDHHIEIILLAAVFVFQIARIKMVFDFRRDKLYISGIAVEFVLLYYIILYMQFWTILVADFFMILLGFIAIRMLILFFVYIWIQCCAKNSYTYLHEEEDIDNILKKFEDSSLSDDDDNIKTEEFNESTKKTFAISITTI